MANNQEQAIIEELKKRAKDGDNMAFQFVPQYLDRMYNPQNYPHFKESHIPWRGGKTETHRMRVEVDEHGNWAAFPSVVLMPDGKLARFADAYEALHYNRSIGNTTEFGKDKDAAIHYGEGAYKPEGLRNYQPTTEPQQERSAAEALQQFDISTRSSPGIEAPNRGMEQELSSDNPLLSDSMLGLYT